MNNKPVAWGMTWKDGEIYDVISPAQHAKEEGDYTVPLYTHPVKELKPKIRRACKKCIEQQAEIDFLKKEILAKHEDWKHEGQQAANARAEIDALKAKDLKKSMAIRSLNTQLKKALQYETFNR